MTIDKIYTSTGPVEDVDITLQEVIGAQITPGFIFIPPGTWEGNLIVTQHNLTLIGTEDSVVQGKAGGPAITILVPNVKIMNLTVESPGEQPAISFDKAKGTQSVIQNVNIRESGGHGIYRDSKFDSTLNTILNCEFGDIDGVGIYVEDGSGPRNIVLGNKGNMEGNFIHWGVNDSLLVGNTSDEGSITLGSNSAENILLDNNVKDISDNGTNNLIS